MLCAAVSHQRHDFMSAFEREYSELKHKVKIDAARPPAFLEPAATPNEYHSIADLMAYADNTLRHSNSGLAESLTALCKAIKTLALRASRAGRYEDDSATQVRLGVSGHMCD